MSQLETPKPTEHYGIGTIAGEAPRTEFRIMGEFDLATYDRYSSALSNALAPTDRFNIMLVEKNFQSYLNIQKFVGRVIILGRKFGLSDRKALGQTVMGQIVNWLTSFRLFLDHAETNLKRRYGGESDQVRQFEEQTALAFDGDLGYRFISKFRNYVQHCGSPLSSITVGSIPMREGLPPQTKASFRLNRDRLIETFDWGAKVGRDLRDTDELFELEPLATSAMERLRDIDRLLLDIAIAEGARTISDVREALGLLPDDVEGVPNLFRFTLNDETTIASLSPSPFLERQGVSDYEMVASGRRSPADLHSATTKPDLPQFDPKTVREIFRRDSRAVQAMSAWQVEGGSTSGFQAIVNGMIAEDGEIEPLVTGMFKMSAVLLHMTAASLGVEPSGLLGGLLDLYAAPDSDD